MSGLKKFAVVAASISMAMLVGCGGDPSRAVQNVTSAAGQANDAVDQAERIREACGGAVAIGKDLLDIAQGGINGGLTAIQNGGDLIDAVSSMDTTEVERIGKEVGRELPPADAKKFREKLDQYGLIIGRCRTATASPSK